MDKQTDLPHTPVLHCSNSCRDKKHRVAVSPSISIAHPAHPTCNISSLPSHAFFFSFLAVFNFESRSVCVFAPGCGCCKSITSDKRGDRNVTPPWFPVGLTERGRWEIGGLRHSPRIKSRQTKVLCSPMSDLTLRSKSESITITQNNKGFLGSMMRLPYAWPRATKRPLSQLIILYLNNGSYSISFPASLFLGCL